ncbi:FtsW/RodA/SpoVE family cell cycle protein [Halobacillus salinarum]|uniref:FtsW/RodA/SpoVE family cell cycle protein n=1 Tax=Halobacillus salinarum TaxID=2932257 RepID=A0ABY4EMS4_9BACI|nr:FtsW/RodA/SpoVE family cell cycle protein [Halobacillus salinarum]UOQ44912.1 FtsW/RodA/SpoVE family cell cycle protein [Halobacillus salinarum]
MKWNKEEYMEQVRKSIKNNDAKQMVTKELEYHIDQEREKLQQKNKMNAQDAEMHAVNQMGSPREVGKHFNNMYRPKTEWWLISLLLMAIGFSFLPMLMVNQDTGYSVSNKISYTLLGIALITAFLFLDYRKLQKWRWVFYGAGLAGISLFNSALVAYVDGSPTLHIGTVELKSIAFVPFFLVAFSSILANKKANLWNGLFLLFIPVYLYWHIADLQSLLILFVMFFTMAWTRPLNRKALLRVLVGGSVAVLTMGLWLFSIMKSYQIERILSFLHPKQYAESSGDLYLRIRELLAESGWFGHFGGKAALPLSHTDFVLVGLTYTFGWFTSIIAILVLLSLMVRLVWVNLYTKEMFGRMLITGGVVFYSVQFLYHLLMSFGLLPFASFSLPFLSYGMGPTLLNAVVFGIALSVYRRKDVIFSSSTG